MVAGVVAGGAITAAAKVGGEIMATDRVGDEVRGEDGVMGAAGVGGIAIVTGISIEPIRRVIIGGGAETTGMLEGIDTEDSVSVR